MAVRHEFAFVQFHRRNLASAPYGPFGRQKLNPPRHWDRPGPPFCIPSPGPRDSWGGGERFLCFLTVVPGTKRGVAFSTSSSPFSSGGPITSPPFPEAERSKIGNALPIRISHSSYRIDSGRLKYSGELASGGTYDKIPPSAGHLGVRSYLIGMIPGNVLNVQGCGG